MAAPPLSSSAISGKLRRLSEKPLLESALSNLSGSWEVVLHSPCVSFIHREGNLFKHQTLCFGLMWFPAPFISSAYLKLL